MQESTAWQLSNVQASPVQKEFENQNLDRYESGVKSFIISVLSRNVTLGLAISRRLAYMKARAQVSKGAVASSAAKPISVAVRPVAGLYKAVAKTAAPVVSSVAGTAGAAVGKATFKTRLHTFAVAENLVRRLPGRPALGMILGMLVLIILASTFFGFGLEVTLDGKPIGYVNSQDDFMRAVNNVEARASEILGRPVVLVPDVSYSFEYADRRMFLDASSVERQLFNQINEIEELYVLTVDGDTVGAYETRDQLDAFLNSLKLRYVSDAGTAGFLQDVQIKRQLVASSQHKTPEEIAGILDSNVREQVTYKVREGDSLESIADLNGITVRELIKLNGSVSDGKLVTGESLVIKNAIPKLSVTSSRTEVFSKPVDFKTEYTTDGNLYKGKSKVVKAGVPGEMQYTDKVEYVNGQETNRVNVGSVMLMQPSTEVIARGTKIPPPKSPTGSFIRPYRGTLTSNYGPRSRGFHTGVDFAGPIGSTVVASDGGVVTFAGWKGTYGNFVIIDHGGGVSTAYAHNSRLFVSTGQQVAKGEAIAALGSTGNSTGPHCHFEVRVNGKTVNPWGYIN